tara:strand:- start:2474 stop:4639 length:2166 start_codon:yes stop_codon:yes gene_type:complete
MEASGASSGASESLSWSDKRKKKKAAKAGVLSDLALSDIELGEDFEELDLYPVTPPFSYVRILFDKRDYSRMYYAIEPKVTPQEEKDLAVVMDVLTRALNIDTETLDMEQSDFLDKAVDDILDSYKLKSRLSNRAKIHYFIKRDLLGYGKVDVLMKDPNIEDVSCDGPNVDIFVYHRRFESLKTNVIWTDEVELERYIIRLAQRCGKHISIAEPLLDATLMDGSRIVMTLGREVSTKGSTFTIRRFRDEPFTPVDLIEFKTYDSMLLSFMWLAFQYGMSMLFVGGTASGKTTSLNAMSLFLPWQHKIVSIEETRELNLPHPNWIPGCTREGFGGEKDASGKSQGEVDMYDLLRAALRERPEYIMVGEIRGAEAYVLFQAMATGHTTYSTFHADSVQSLVHRLENKPIEIPRVLIPALDGLSIQIQTRVGGKRVRRVKQVIEIIGVDPHSGELLTNEVFRWDGQTDEYVFSGKSYMLEKIMMKANLNRVEVMEEIKRRQLVVEYAHRQNIRYYQDFAKLVAEYYVHPEDVMRNVYVDLEGGEVETKKRRKKRTKEPVDVSKFPQKAQSNLKKKRDAEVKRRMKEEEKISKITDSKKKTKAEAVEIARRKKEDTIYEATLLKEQAKHAPLDQLNPLASQLSVGDVSALNPVEARRMLKYVNSEIGKRYKAESQIEKLASKPDKQSKAVSSEEKRRVSALENLKKSLAKGISRGPEPSWWHSWL